MTIAYWSVLAFALMAFPLALLGQIPGITLPDFREPRPRAEKLAGWKARSNWAHMNTLETFPFFAAGVIISLSAGAAPETIDTLALAFIASRVLYSILYIAGFGILRSLVWAAGIGLIIAMFVQAA
ncbi:MAG: hypothetical protein COA47_01460 [Robiginitomaculum sp.]|nr:MAG: hypothetical protein COA47_01460 [Robiginitomaculum sp.]